MHEQPQPQQGGGPALGAIQEESEISTTVKPSMSGEKRSMVVKEQADGIERGRLLRRRWRAVEV